MTCELGWLKRLHNWDAPDAGGGTADKVKAMATNLEDLTVPDPGWSNVKTMA